MADQNFFRISDRDSTEVRALKRHAQTVYEQMHEHGVSIQHYGLTHRMGSAIEHLEIAIMLAVKEMTRQVGEK